METTATMGLANKKRPARALSCDQRDTPVWTPCRVDVTG
jgi:hypothetical protein